MINELSRNKLFNKLQDVLGIEHAEVLIEHLPPVGWADVATKRDLEPLTARLDALTSRVDSLATEVRDLRRDFGALRSEMTSQFHTIVFAMIGMMVTLTGLVFAAAKLS